MTLKLVSLINAIALASADNNPGMNSQAVNRVIQLLNRLTDKLNQEASREQAAFDEWSCWSDETKATLNSNIMDEQAQIKQATDNIVLYTGKKAKYEQSEKNHERVKAETKQNLADKLAAFNEKDSKDKKEIGELQNNLITTQYAISALNEGRSKAGISYLAKLQEESSTSLTKTAQDALKEVLKTPASLLQSGNSGMEMVIGRLRSISNEFTDDIHTVSTSLAKAHMNFLNTQYRLNNQISTSHSAMIASRTAASASSKLLTENRNVKARQTDLYKADSKTLKDLTKETKVRMVNWAARQTDRNNEMQALASAIGALSPTSTKDVAITSLLTLEQDPEQTIADNKKSSRNDNRASAGGQASGQDTEFYAFGMLIKEIRRSIDIIKQQMKADTEMNKQCEADQQGIKAEKRENNNQRTQAKNDRNHANAENTQALNMESVTVFKIANSSANLKNITTMHNNEVATMRQNLATVNEDMASVQQALDFLMDYYTKDNAQDGQQKTQWSLLDLSQATTQQQPFDMEEARRNQTGNQNKFEGGVSSRQGAKRAGQSVTMMLKMMVDDLKKHAKDLMENVAEADHEFKEYLGDNQEQMKDLNNLKEGYEQASLEALADSTAATKAIGKTNTIEVNLKAATSAFQTQCDGILDKYDNLMVANKDAIDNYVKVIGFLESGVPSLLQKKQVSFLSKVRKN